MTSNSVTSDNDHIDFIARTLDSCETNDRNTRVKHCIALYDYLLKELYFVKKHRIFKKIAIARKKNLEYCPDNNIHFMIIDFLPTALASFLLKNDFSFLKNKGEEITALYINIAGKNVSSFDIPFLNAKIKDWEGLRFLNRSIDPAILYFDLENDVSLPDMKTCMQRAGIDGEVAHTAMEDALVVVKLLRNKFFKEGNDVLRKKEQKKKDNRS